MGLISRVSSRTYRQTSHYNKKMVCVPCIFIPLFLWIYNKFLHPIVDPIMRKWMGKPARKIKETGDEKKSCPVSGKGGDACEAKVEEKAEAAAPEVTNIDEQGDSDDDTPVVTRRTTRSRSRKAE